MLFSWVQALALLEFQPENCPPLELLFTVDEETGLTGAKTLDVQTLGLSSRRMLNLDTEKWGEICIGCAGGGGVTLTLEVIFECAGSDCWYRNHILAFCMHLYSHGNNSEFDQKGKRILIAWNQYLCTVCFHWEWILWSRLKSKRSLQALFCLTSEYLDCWEDTPAWILTSTGKMVAAICLD